jgi:hypothetical protein
MPRLLSDEDLSPVIDDNGPQVMVEGDDLRDEPRRA